MIVEELIKTYDGKPVVDSVSFSLPKGKVTSLIGPNGAGKSTVMGMISRLIARDGGLVEFEGQDIGKWKSKELSKRLAILTQSNHIQNEHGGGECQVYHHGADGVGQHVLVRDDKIT